jgi:predicted Zn-dependent protease
MTLQTGPEQMAGTMTRREFVRVTTLAAAGLATGCAANPATGRRQLMLVSEQQEIDIDRQNSPHQLSSDYGEVQDPELAGYLQRTGQSLVSVAHRREMPYRFKPVNATYINAYAFPGGTIAATRGILLKLQNEGELASLLGHELGHVNARHTASQMSKGMLTQVLVGGASVLAGTQSQAFGQLASQLGMLGAGALLASYSRDNEREADALGLKYMADAGYNPAGFEGLMGMLRRLNKERPSSIELMFSTHPMSEERYQNTVDAIRTQYPGRGDRPFYRERYLDHTAGLRRIGGAIEAMQLGEKEMAKENYTAAEERFRLALDQAPDDYAGLLMMTKCLMAQKKDSRAVPFIEKARTIYPREPQALHLSGFIGIRQKRFENALRNFEEYDRLLPGNPSISFLEGYCQEGMGHRREAATHYDAYLRKVRQGDMAKHAYTRLVQWGFIRQ